MHGFHQGLHHCRPERHFHPHASERLSIGRQLAAMKSKLGQPYKLGPNVPFWDASYNGPWDCSSFVAWALWQAGDRRRLGCRPYSPAAEHDPTKQKATKQVLWAYTDWFFHDLEKQGIKIDQDEALETPGAICLHRPHEIHKIGHIGVSLGNGKVIEAHGIGHVLPNGKIHYGPEKGTIADRNVKGLFKHWYLLKRGCGHGGIGWRL